VSPNQPYVRSDVVLDHDRFELNEVAAMSLMSIDLLARCEPRLRSILRICNDVIAINRHLICITAQRRNWIPMGLTSQVQYSMKQLDVQYCITDAITSLYFTLLHFASLCFTLLHFASLYGLQNYCTPPLLPQ
jgi:hypothetical protein